MDTTTKPNSPPLNIILGGAGLGSPAFKADEDANQFLNTFIARGYNQLDTARVYPASEERLGKVSAAARLTIDTKVMPGMPSAGDSKPKQVHTKAQVLADIDESLKTLNTTQINIEYLHAPDRNTPFSDACEAMDEAHKAGKIRAWGLSNYTAQEVQSIVDICDERDLLRPAVYQGQYNPLVRGGEKELFPVLRKAGMAFYAYSPAAGGFFAGNYQSPRPGGRFDVKSRAGRISVPQWLKARLMEAAESVRKIASSHGIDGHSASLRWVLHHSILSREHGDSIIIGASSMDQLKANLDAVEMGPLPEDLVVALNGVFNECDGDVVPYHA